MWSGWVWQRAHSREMGEQTVVYQVFVRKQYMEVLNVLVPIFLFPRALDTVWNNSMSIGY